MWCGLPPVARGQHVLVFEGRLRQQIQKHLEYAAVGRLVHRSGHHQRPGPRHLAGGPDHAGVVEVRQQQGLRRQVADLQPLHMHPQKLQPLLDRIQQR